VQYVAEPESFYNQTTPPKPTTLFEGPSLYLSISIFRGTVGDLGDYFVQLFIIINLDKDRLLALCLALLLLRSATKGGT